jgi:hypothetical protein
MGVGMVDNLRKKGQETTTLYAFLLVIDSTTVMTRTCSTCTTPRYSDGAFSLNSFACMFSQTMLTTASVGQRGTAWFVKKIISHT